MDPDTARKLFHSCGTVLCLDMPEGAEFGIDMRSWVVGPKFKGVKMIPTGIHFIYYSLPDKYSSPEGAAPMSFGTRLGFWVHLVRGDVLVYKWDKKTEDFAPTGSARGLSTDDVERYREGVRRYDFDAHLGAFNTGKDGHRAWSRLSECISLGVLKKMVGEGKVIGGDTLANHRIWSAASAPGEGELGLDAVSSKAAMGGSATTGMYNLPNYTFVPRRACPPGSTPADITKHSLDRTYLVSQLVQTYSNRTGAAVMEDDEAIRELLGEMQFAFLCFLLGNSFEAFDQWKKLVVNICGVVDGIQLFHSALLRCFLAVLQDELEQAPPTFFEDVFGGTHKDENFLVSSLERLYSDMADVHAAGELHDKIYAQAHVFRKFFKDRFAVELPLGLATKGNIPADTFEGSEYAPVIVRSLEASLMRESEGSSTYFAGALEEGAEYGRWKGDPEKVTLWEKLDMLHIEDEDTMEESGS